MQRKNSVLPIIFGALQIHVFTTHKMGAVFALAAASVKPDTLREMPILNGKKERQREIRCTTCGHDSPSEIPKQRARAFMMASTATQLNGRASESAPCCAHS